MANEIYDWNMISKDFIRGITIRDLETQEVKIKFPTQEELSTKYGCSLVQLRNVSQRDNWVIQRAQFRQKLKLKESQVDLNDLVGEGTKFDNYHLTTLEKVNKLVSDYLEPYIVNLENPDLINNEDIKPLTIKDLREISAIIKESHITVRSILGEGTPTNLIDEARESNNDINNKVKINSNKIKDMTKKISEAEKLKKELEDKKQQLININEKTKRKKGVK